MATIPLRAKLFFFFFVSGFCGLVYQIVWSRMAMGFFGVTAPILSAVVSVFMLGLALGSWAGGRWIGPMVRRTGRSPLFFYAAAEAVIGLGAFAAPRLLQLGEQQLRGLPTSNSTVYLAGAVFAIGLSLLPWCFAMGTTFPFVSAFLCQTRDRDGLKFSFLYTANVAGALSGVVAVLVLIETLGFHHTLFVAGALNFLIAAFAFGSGRRTENKPLVPPPDVSPGVSGRGSVFAFLFMTGFTSMALEMVWVRNFTPVLGTEVYAFSSLLFVYLLATFLGASWYRRDSNHGNVRSAPLLIGALAIAGVAPILLNDPRLWTRLFSTHLQTVCVAVALVSLAPFCGVLGYLTPRLIDRHFHDSPSAVGRAYAVNAAGCILGPLAAGFFLLPRWGAKGSWVLLAIPYAVAFFLVSGRVLPWRRWGARGTMLALLAIAAFRSESFELVMAAPGSWVLRDHTATVVCAGSGREKRLWVNGFGMTCLTPITKFMAHASLAFQEAPPKKGLVICLGMGTTHRSTLSWGIESVAVELVPSVKDALPYFWDDAGVVIKNPRGRIIVDDGKRFLQRTKERFDAIILDPPPPVEAAGSSLLYSRDFYRLAKQQLSQQGILQQWIPYQPHRDEEAILCAVARSLAEEFPHVRAFRSIGGLGCHFLASQDPLPPVTAAELARRMPPAAQQDFLEWVPNTSAQDYWANFLSREIPLQALLSDTPAERITDDRPFNEYFLIRRWWKRWKQVSGGRFD